MIPPPPAPSSYLSLPPSVSTAGSLLCLWEGVLLRLGSREKDAIARIFFGKQSQETLTGEWESRVTEAMQPSLTGAAGASQGWEHTSVTPTWGEGAVKHRGPLLGTMICWQVQLAEWMHGAGPGGPRKPPGITMLPTAVSKMTSAAGDRRAGLLLKLWWQRQNKDV